MSGLPAPPLAGLDRALKAASDIVFSNRNPAPKEFSEADLWREAVSCILGSAVRHEQAMAALGALEKAGVLDPPSHPADSPRLEALIFGVLAPKNQTISYRFPRTRAGQIAGAVNSLYGSGTSLREICGRGDPRDVRRTLIAVPGFGPKQASLFLRNTGFTSDLAILDCHVLRYMSWQGGPTIGKPVRTLARYEYLENLLRIDADRLGVPLGQFDWIVWLVMRAWQGREH